MPDRKQGKLASSPTEPHNAFFPKGRCRYCSKTFPKKRPWQKFCNKKCKNDYWLLQYTLDAQINEEKS